MAILFDRLAHSHIKNGYYPTDEATLERLASYFHPIKGNTSIMDPCSGEGFAISELKHVLESKSTFSVQSYGIEYDKDRAYSSKSLMDTCIHGDIQDCVVKHNQFGLMFLNPPYGDLVSSGANNFNRQHGGRQRLEKLFFDQTASSLVFGGILVLIIPDYCLDDAFVKMISRRFTNIRAFRARDDTYKQVVILGERVKVHENQQLKQSEELLNDYRENGFPEMTFFSEPFYEVPGVIAQNPIFCTKVDKEQLDNELKTNSGMWSNFQSQFMQNDAKARRPLFKMSDWHLALSLAAGLVTGVVVSNDGKRRVLVKGSTVKTKVSTETISVDDDGNTTETVTQIDKFVPTIRAIELTENHSKGEIFTIQ